MLGRGAQLRIAPIDLILDDKEDENSEREREREGELGCHGQRRLRSDDQPDVADRAGHDTAQEVERPERSGRGSRPVGGSADRNWLRDRREGDAPGLIGLRELGTARRWRRPGRSGGRL